MTLAVLDFRLEAGAPAPTPQDVLERLGGAFEFVGVDAERGREHCLRQVEGLRMLRAPDHLIDLAARGAESALWVQVSEGARGFEFLLVPQMNLRIETDESNADLVLRCAEALDCHLTECG